MNIDSVVLSTKELSESLEKIAKGLAQRFTHKLPSGLSKPPSGDDFVEVTLTELENIIRLLPASAPGPDGITTRMLKVLFDYAPQDLLNIVNFSLKIPGFQESGG